ncbi:MAG: hypothetical protein D6701_14635, partial [Gemmatimonadetes bacterium]
PSLAGPAAGSGEPGAPAWPEDDGAEGADDAAEGGATGGAGAPFDAPADAWATPVTPATPVGAETPLDAAGGTTGDGTPGSDDRPETDVAPAELPGRSEAPAAPGGVGPSGWAFDDGGATDGPDDDAVEVADLAPDVPTLEEILGDTEPGAAGAADGGGEADAGEASDGLPADDLWLSSLRPEPREDEDA